MFPPCWSQTKVGPSEGKQKARTEGERQMLTPVHYHIWLPVKFKIIWLKLLEGNAAVLLLNFDALCNSFLLHPCSMLNSEGWTVVSICVMCYKHLVSNYPNNHHTYLYICRTVPVMNEKHGDPQTKHSAEVWLSVLELIDCYLCSVDFLARWDWTSRFDDPVAAPQTSANVGRIKGWMQESHKYWSSKHNYTCCFMWNNGGSMPRNVK